MAGRIRRDAVLSGDYMYNDEYVQRTFARLCKTAEADANRKLILIAIAAALLSLGIRAMFENPAQASHAKHVEASFSVPSQ